MIYGDAPTVESTETTCIQLVLALQLVVSSIIRVCSGIDTLHRYSPGSVRMPI